MSLRAGSFFTSLFIISILTLIPYQQVQAAVPAEVGTGQTVTITIADSGTVVDHDIVVRNGGTLIIEPGVTLKFAEPATNIIKVDAGGTLRIGSLSGARAQLLPENYPAETSRLSGMKGIENSGTLIIENALIWGASSGVDNKNSGVVEVTGSEFTRCNYGIKSNNGQIKVFNSNFNYNGDAIAVTDVSAVASQTSQICGNRFLNNNRSIHLAGRNNINIRYNNFQESFDDELGQIWNGETILLDFGSNNDQVFIAYNNFDHSRTVYDPENGNYYYIIGNNGSPVGIYDCYWKNNDVAYTTITAITNANLVGFTDEKAPNSIVAVLSPRSTPVNITGQDNDSPVLVDVSPLKARRGLVHLTVVISDEGWGVESSSVKVKVGGQEATLHSTGYNSRQYFYYLTVNLSEEGHYEWKVDAKDVAGNPLEIPSGLVGRKLEISDKFSELWTPKAWEDFAAGTYQLITVPIYPVDTDHKQVLGMEALGSNVARWQNGSYKYYGNPELEPIAPGRGFWIKFDASESYESKKIEGDRQLERQNYLQQTLQPGWHLIGNPFPTDITLKHITFKTPDGKHYSFEQAVLAGYINYGLWWFDRDRYRFEKERLKSWTGYWLRVKKECDIVYWSTPQNVYASSITDWDVQLTVSQNNSYDGAGYFGLIRAASASIDNFDAIKPPVLSDGIKSYFVLNAAGQEFGADFRPGNTRQESWDYVVTGLTPGEAKLEWSTLNSVPPNQQLILKDLTTGKEVDLRKTNVYQFSVGGETERRFKITLTDVGQQAVTIANIRMNNNPFAPLREELVITYDLNLDATLEIKIYDWVGNLVYVYPNTAVRAGTDLNFRWSGTNNRGKMVANGIYFCKITARAGNSQTTQVIKIAVVN